MLERYGTLVREEMPLIALFAILGTAAFVLYRKTAGIDERPRSRPLAGSSRLLVAAAVLTGTWTAVQKASVFDDAYISLRYARNLLEGNGLVWNIGERVEGYTNFLWVMLVAAGSWISGCELPLVALFGCLLAYVAGVLVLGHVERRIFGAGFPVVAVLYALQNTTTDYATSGMETGFATLCVVTGVLFLTRRPTAGRAGIAGGWLMAATLTRPDHGLFWIAGGCVVLLDVFAREPWDPASTRFSRPSVVRVWAYTATVIPYLAYLGWKWTYYGDLLPNTYYAKSAGSAYFDQGGIYALSFLLGAHLWVILPLAAIGACPPLRSRGSRALVVFCVVALPAYTLYVIKVGGDFMYGRFFLVTLPLWLLLARRGIQRLGRDAVWRGAVAAGVLTATLGGVGILDAKHKSAWYMGNESYNYRVKQWFPKVVVKHHNWRVGDRFSRYMQQRGIEPVIATTGIGMVGYYSQLELVDLRGLTDRKTARMKIERRRKPGHEKWPRRRYLDRRGVQIIRAERYHPERWQPTTEVVLGQRSKRRRWFFYRYDAELVDQLERHAPEVKITRIEPAIDSWLVGSPLRSLETLTEDAEFFQRYYFDTHEDPRREAAVQELLRQSADGQSAAVATKPGGPKSPENRVVTRSSRYSPIP